jgi:hypothetical protein
LIRTCSGCSGLIAFARDKVLVVFITNFPQFARIRFTEVDSGKVFGETFIASPDEMTFASKLREAPFGLNSD